MTKVFRIYKTTNDDIKSQSGYEDRYCSFKLERVHTGYDEFSTEEEAVRWLQRNGGLRDTYTILPVWELNWDDMELQLQNVQ
jgi:hypothetical protein